MLKKLMSMPLSAFLGYLAVPLLILFTFRVGMDYSETGGPVWDSVKRVVRSPFGSGPVRPPVSGGGGPSVSYYSALTGVFGNEESARNMRTRLASDRISGKILYQNGRYYVLVGQYASEGAARETIEALRRKGYPGARLIVPSGASG